MVKHVCEICSREFKQKIHLTKHKQRKNPCKKLDTPREELEQANVIVSSRQIKHRVAHTPLKEMKPLSWFHENTPGLYRCVTKDIHAWIEKGEKFVVFHGQVKTGKRLAVEIYALYSTPLEGTKIVHLFVSSWVRRADDNQRRELNTYLRGSPSNQRVFNINSEKSRKRCTDKLEELIRVFDTVIVHLDELDYGSGANQHMAAVFDYCMSHEKIKIISYSASPEEAICQRLANGAYSPPKVVVYEPPASYRGAEWFCRKGLVTEATPFFEFSEEGMPIALSEDAKGILERAKARLDSTDPRTNRKHLIIVRQNNAFGEVHDMIQSGKFPELEDSLDTRILCHFVHSNTAYNTITVKWDDYNWWKRQLEVERTGKYLLVLFIDQGSSRSTDWFCHPWLSAYHDYHPPDTPVNTSLQSNLRLVYYTNKFCDGKQVYNDEEFEPELHGQKDVVEYAAGIIPLSAVKRVVSTRAKVYEQLPTFGPVITVKLSQQELEQHSPMLNANLNEESRGILRTLILSKLKGKEKSLLAGRELRGKRRYHFTENLAQGGIYYVAGNAYRNLNSRPGGGCNDADYDERARYFWIDIAMDDLQFTWESELVKIPRGTVYITHGIADPEIDDTASVGSDDTAVEHQHRTKKTSMYAAK